MAGVADAILDALERGGVRCLFGIPDPAFLGLLTRAQARGFTIVTPHHEAAAGFMAEAAARVTGVPAAVLLSPGPGVANALPAMACARAERAPVLFLGGARGDLRQPDLTGRFQHMDQMPLVAGAVKYAARIATPEQAGAAVARALAMAREGTPGPAYLDCPFDVMMARAEQALPTLPPVTFDADAFARAVTLIGEARAPMLLVGHGLSASARDAVADLARVMGCPVVLTPGAAALPGLVTRCFPYGFSPVTAEVMAQADLVLAMGTALGEAVHHGRWRHWRAGDATRRWIRIDGDGATIGINRPLDVALVGDAGSMARALADMATRAAHPDLARWAAAEGERRAAWDHAARAHGETPIHPARLVAEVMAAIPPEALLVRDGGAGVLFQLSQGAPHDGGVLWSRAFGHLGTGLPYAIGALVAEQARRPALVLSGDSAMLFHIGEIEVAVRLGLPLVCVVAVDHQWGLEAAAYRQHVGPDAPRPGAAWGTATRFDRIAQGFGALGLYVDAAGDLPAALAQAFGHGGPVVIHAAIDADANGADLPGWAELTSWYSDGMGQ
jgi:thiamine pyrophosphate-dependent acetolactate synthase large subunit-like protein